MTWRYSGDDPGSASSSGMTSVSCLHPHRHQDVKRGGAFAVLDDGGGAGIGELEQGGVAVELGRDVEQIAGVEADIDRRGIGIDLDLFRRAARIRVVDGQRQAPVAQSELHRASPRGPAAGY